MARLAGCGRRSSAGRRCSVRLSAMSAARTPGGGAPVSRQPTTRGGNKPIGCPSNAVVASMPPTPQPNTAKPLTTGVWLSVPTRESGNAHSFPSCATVARRWRVWPAGRPRKRCRFGKPAGFAPASRRMTGQSRPKGWVASSARHAGQRLARPDRAGQPQPLAPRTSVPRPVCHASGVPPPLRRHRQQGRAGDGGAPGHPGGNREPGPERAERLMRRHIASARDNLLQRAATVV